MRDRKPDTPDINKIKCEDCRYSVDNVNEERPKMRFCAISGHALDIMDKGLPIWGCPIKDAYMQNGEPMLKYKDCESLVFYAALMGREVAKGADEKEALAKLQGAIVMFMMIDGISSSRADDISDFVFDLYQKSFIAYFEDKGEDEQE